VRILVISNLYPPPWLGGYELACQAVVEGLRARGHTVYVLTSSYKAENCPPEPHIFRLLNHYWGSYPDGDLTLTWWQAARSMWLDFANYRKVKECIQQLRPDFAYLWNLQRVSPVPVIGAIRKSGIAYAIHLMDYWLMESRLTPDVVRKLLLRAMIWLPRRMIEPLLMSNQLISMSETVRREYIKGGFPANKIRVIYHGVKINSERCEDATGSHRQGLFKILFAGQIIESKGVHTLLSALAELIHLRSAQNICLDIIGKGDREYTKKLQDLIHRYHLEGFVNFVGEVPKQELLDRYGEYDLLVLPTERVEPFGMVVIEAMASGIPVIASDLGGPAEIITNGETGILVPAGDSVRLASAIGDLMCSDRLRETIRNKALALVRKKFSIETSVAQIERYMQEQVDARD
jgi:glycogen(starch) synthase